MILAAASSRVKMTWPDALAFEIADPPRNREQVGRLPDMRLYVAHSSNASRHEIKACMASLIMKFTSVAETPTASPIPRCVLP